MLSPDVFKTTFDHEIFIQKSCFLKERNHWKSTEIFVATVHDSQSRKQITEP
jgi:hypothetical protein